MIAAEPKDGTHCPPPKHVARRADQQTSLQRPRPRSAHTVTLIRFTNPLSMYAHAIAITAVPMNPDRIMKVRIAFPREIISSEASAWRIARARAHRGGRWRQPQIRWAGLRMLLTHRYPSESSSAQNPSSQNVHVLPRRSRVWLAIYD